MPNLYLVRTVLREIFARPSSARVVEPDLVMDDPEKVAAYTRAGRTDGVMAASYLYQCAHVCDVVRSGDTVVDLGCGPATQLAMIAALNPDVSFIGVDLSPEMLDRARAHVAALGLHNVTFEACDMTSLTKLGSASVDAVISTVALHHLPTYAHLDAAFAEAARILKPDGGVYLVDFGHLKSEASIQFFARRYEDRVPALFTDDYVYSLRAAFSRDDFARAHAAHLGDRAVLRSTFALPFLVVVKSPSRRAEDDGVHERLRALFDALPGEHQRDFRDLSTFFRLGGLPSPL